MHTHVHTTRRNTAALKKIDGATGLVAADLTHPGECHRVADAAVRAMDGLNGLVNCAGVLRGGAIGSLDTKSLMDGFDFNFQINTR